MPSFRDNSGREWPLTLDGLLLADLRDQHKIDLADLAGETWLRLERDPALLTVALTALLADQLPSGTSRRDLARQLTGETLVPALAALVEAARLFFPARHWSALASAWESLQTTTEQWDQLRPMVALLNRPDMPAAMKEAVFAAIDEQIRATMNSGGLPASPEKTCASGPADTPPKSASDSPATADSTPAA